jgi:hypothetical protein
MGAATAHGPPVTSSFRSARASPTGDSSTAAANNVQSGEAGDMRLLSGKRLQISADVDAAGLAKLKEILTKYEEILKMLQ